MNTIKLPYSNKCVTNDMWIGVGIHLEKYNAFKLNDLDYDLLVIANTYLNPINIFLNNKDELPIKNGKIIFDLTLIYGCKRNRYIAAEIIDGVLDINSVKIIVNLDNLIKKIGQEYFLKNQYLVLNSHLPNVDKYSILHCLEEYEYY